jgi:hypothetical protein
VEDFTFLDLAKSIYGLDVVLYLLMGYLDFSALVLGSKVEDHQQTTNIYQVDNSKISMQTQNF